MPDAPIPFPLSSAPGNNVFESAGRLINCYSEPLITGARGGKDTALGHTPGNVWRRAPGVRSFVLGSYTGWRGGIVIGNQIYAAFTGGSSAVASYTSAGVETLLGTQSGSAPRTKKVFWARNDKSNPDVIFVDPDNGAYQVTVTPSVIVYPDTNLNATIGVPNSCCFLDGYFVFTSGSGKVIASQLNDTAIDPLDFLQIDGNSGGLLRAIAFNQLYLFGTDTLEIHQDTANPVGWPFTRSVLIPKGLLGRYAVTGYEPGFGRGIVFVGNDAIVYTLSGYQLQPIGIPDVHRAIRKFLNGGGSVDAIEMFPYVVAGHSVVVLTLDGVATWAFDIDVGRWHERQSLSIPQTWWRAYASVYAFNKWLAGDSASSNILEITEQSMTELGQPFAFDITSGPVTAFPRRLRVAQVTLDIARGVGQATGIPPIQTNPTCLISWSDDGGMNWSDPVIRPLGPQMTSPAPVRVNRTGMTKDQGRKWHVVVYDPVQVELIGGSMNSELRNY